MVLANLGEICARIKEKAREVEVTGGTEEDLKIGIEQILREEVWDKLGVPAPRYEYRVKDLSAEHWGRIDALYGLTIFEYKRPNELRKSNVRDEAIRKLRDEYIPYLLNDSEIYKHIKAIEERGLIPIIAGIIWDGYNVIFCEYNIKTKEFKHSPLIELNEEVLRKIIGTVIATYKKKIDARILASDFGYKSKVAHLVVKTFYEKLNNPSERTKKIFEEWIKLTSQALSISGEELKKISGDYGFKEEVDGLKLFFAIQTYYALIIKLLAVEVCARFYNSLAGSFFKEVENAITQGNLKEVLEKLESGWYYTYFGIKNFLEGGFFNWYIYEWDKKIEDAVKEVIRTLLEYDIESIIVDPSSARDVFKLLYEELVPRKEVRRKLGIYTTPDWLAELIIEELSRGKDIVNARWLDPACGTGTFLSLIIKKIASVGKGRYKPNELLKIICSNVVGFDIDSLSVLTARANYLIALASERLLEYKGYDERGEIEKIEIPVYLANSVVTAKKMEDKINVEGKLIEVVQIKAGGEIFQIPARILDKAIDMLNEFKEYIEVEYSFDAIKDEVKRKYGLTREELKLIQDVYEKLLKFKKDNVDSVWIPVLKSYLVSTYYKNFDFVVGNPPWIAYRYIANTEYQENIKFLIKDVYGLVTEGHLMTHMEMATLFLVRCLDVYLKDNGLLGFVMPKSIMYSDQHHNFRTQKIPLGYKIEKFIDCRVEPLFYVPTCAVIVRKKFEKSEEVPTLFIEGRLPEDKHKIIPLDQALLNLKKRDGKLYLNSIGSRSFFDEKKITIAKERSYYYDKFYQGATIVPQFCWFVDVIDWNVPIVESSKRVYARGVAKYEYKIGPLPIERDYLYYVLTSAEVLPFCHLMPNIAVLPIIPLKNKYDLLTRNRIKSGEIKAPNLVKWLEKLKKCGKRLGMRKLKKMSIYERLDYGHYLTNQNPNAKFIVVYIACGTHLTSCVVNNEYWLKESKLEKSVIIESSLYRYFTNEKYEAFYLSAILNSNVLDDLIKPMQAKGFTGAGRTIHKNH